MDLLELTSGPFGAVHRLLERYKDQLGSFYPTLRPLVSALFFLLILAVVLAVPFHIFGDYKYIACTQLILVAVYYLSLISWKGGYLDRFVFCLVLLATTAAAPTLLTGDRLVDILGAAAPTEFPTGSALPRLEFFLHSMIRGVANVVWALPALFFAFTFYPETDSQRDVQWLERLGIATKVGFFLQLLVAAVILWQARVFAVTKAPTQAALPILQQKIESLQISYTAFTLCYLAFGLVAALLVKRWARIGDNRLLLGTMVGIVVIQGCFSLATSAGYQLFRFYPSARADRQLVEVYRSEDRQVVYANNLTRRISPSKLGEWQAYSICRHPGSYEFDVEIMSRDEFRQRFPNPGIIEDIRQNSPQQLFCQPEPTQPGST